MSASLCISPNYTNLESAILLRHASAADVTGLQFCPGGGERGEGLDSFSQATCYAHVLLMVTFTAKSLQDKLLAGLCSKMRCQMEHQL